MQDGHAILSAALGTEHLQTRCVIAYLADLYDNWHKDECGEGYDAKAVEWKAR